MDINKLSIILLSYIGYLFSMIYFILFFLLQGEKHKEFGRSGKTD